jgi:predicted PurR-regulated permease PerM
MAATGGNTTFIQDLNTSVNSYLPAGLSIDIEQKVADVVSIVSGNIAGIFSTTVATVGDIFLFIIAVFYFLKDGKDWKKVVVAVSPLADEDDTVILDHLGNSVSVVMKGYLFIAVVQGILMGCGLAIFGVPNAALWGVVAGVTSVIPMLGTGLVAVPAVLYLLFVGSPFAAVGLAIWAFALVGTIDNFLQPFVVGGKMHISPLLVLFAVLGGVSVLGPVGILIGPLSVSLLYSLIGVYRHKTA